MKVSCNETNKFALLIRMETMKMLGHRGFGHIGGCFSCADLLAVLYNEVMKFDPKEPDWEDRDRLIISKGHAGPSAYSTLALKGFFPKEWLLTLNEGGTNLPSHCDKTKTPGIDFTTGSLGQGLSIGVGVAYAYKMDNKPNSVYVLLGDGEIQEGQIWEAAMSASKFALDNIYCFVDANGYQIDGSTDEIMPLGDIAEKFRSFGWHTQQVDGHDVDSIGASIDIAKKVNNKPCAIILDTIKGFGYDEISDIKNLNHHMAISKELCERALEKFERDLSNL